MGVFIVGSAARPVNAGFCRTFYSCASTRLGGCWFR